jgi:hypothetical protein
MGENLVLGLFFCVPVIAAGYLALLVRRQGGIARLPRWPRILLINSLVFLFFLGLLCFSSEIYYRFFCDTTDSLLYTKTSQRWMQRHWHNNHNGIRDNVDYALTRYSGRRRISFVGDSFTAAEGVADVEDRFVNRIRKLHPEWEVHLLAEPGFDTGDELFYLQAATQKGYELDQVVLVYCLNDVSDMLPEHTESVQRIKRYIANSGWLERNSFLFNTLAHRLKACRDPFMKEYFGFVRDAYRGPAWDQQKQRLQAMRDLVEARGGRLAVVTFPFLNALGPNYEYAFVHKQLAGFWRDLKVPYLDLWPILQSYAPSQVTVNAHDAHPNVFANELATRAIDDFLNQQDSLKSPAVSR